MKYVVAIVVAVVLAVAGWRIVEPNVANVVLQDDIKDTAAQMGWSTGLSEPKSDDQLRNIVIGKAKRQGIVLVPDQITVRHVGTEQRPLWFMAADYTANVDLWIFSFALHFSPASNGEGKFWGTVAGGQPRPTGSAKVPPTTSPRPPDPVKSSPKGPPKTLEYKDIPQSLKQPQ